MQPIPAGQIPNTINKIYIFFTNLHLQLLWPPDCLPLNSTTEDVKRIINQSTRKLTIHKETTFTKWADVYQCWWDLALVTWVNKRLKASQPVVTYIIHRLSNQWKQKLGIWGTVDNTAVFHHIHFFLLCVKCTDFCCGHANIEHNPNFKHYHQHADINLWLHEVETFANNSQWLAPWNVSTMI